MRKIYEIAEEIATEWKKVNYAAKPYLDAMSRLCEITDNYGYDSADHIIRYFLSNAGSFRGADAKRLKNELKALVGMKQAK